MKVFNIKQAQANFDRLLAAVDTGEEVYIARRTTPVVMVVPFRAPKRGKRKFGALKNEMSAARKKKKR